MQTRSWHIITGEYPPQPGGVGDYSAQLAAALASAGDRVHVWAPRCDRSDPAVDGVVVHRLSTHFGLRSLRELEAGLATCSSPRRLLVQYVAGAFGYHAMNLPLCLWLLRRREDPIWVMFHEFAYPLGWRLRPSHNLLGLVTPVMGTILAARADRIFVSTPAWGRRIPAFAHRARPITWLPVPSNVPLHVDEGAARSVRASITRGRAVSVIGHFGTYGPSLTKLLSPIVISLLQRYPDWLMLLLGRGSQVYAAELRSRRADMAERIVAAGALPGAQLAAHLKACDIMVQPYPDGVTSRRSSLMAALALGMPIVTNDGESSEPLWRDQSAVAVAPAPTSEAIVATTEELMALPSRRAELADRAAAFYEAHFALNRTVLVLRSQASQDDRAFSRGE